MPHVVIPWRDDGPHRRAALDWVLARYAEHHPGWSLQLAECLGAGPWIKAKAVMPAIAGAPDDVVILADADVWSDGLNLAVDHVRGGDAWAIPHWSVHRLTEHATAQALAGSAWEGLELDQPIYTGIEGGGFVIAHRDVLLAIPLDPRFVGWGQEDESHAMALTSLLGPPWRGRADLVHLWHPSQERLCRRRGSVESWNLRRRYARARHDPNLMRQLLEEARHALHADQHALHDHSPQLVR